ncbi:MAG: bacteriohemerythrin [Planctomycetota bacterium]|jgi:hemerythrin-like metal-binding protein
MIEWDDEKYSVGISKIDSEHKKFIDTINRAILVDQNSNHPKEDVMEVLNEMKEYADTHFATEETYMVKFNYSDYESHRKKHQDFIIETTAFFDKITNGDRQLISEILEHLKSWLVNHIQDTDAKYASCFKEHGLK